MVQELFTEEHFKALYGLTNDYVFFLKRVEGSFEYLYINDPTKDVFLKSPIGQRMEECLTPEHAKPIFESYERAVSERKVVTYRDFYLFSDHERMNETTVTPIFRENGTYILAITREISRQKEIEEKYLFFQSLLTVSVDPTVVIRRDGTIFEMNNRFQELFGLPNEKYKGTAYLELPIHDKDDIVSTLENFNLAWEGKGRSSILLKRKKADGRVGTFLTSFSPIRNGNEVIALFILFQEITEELKLKEDLKSTLNVLEGYKKGISTAAIVAITDHTGNIHHVNDLYVETSSYLEHELVGTFYDVFDQNQHPYSFFQSIREKVNAGDIWTGELKHRKKDGDIYWVDATVIPLKDGEEVIEKYLIIEFDITDKKKVLTDLRSIEKTFNLITENSNDLIAVTDEYGFVLYTSPSHEKRLGLEKEELLGRYYTDIFSEESRLKWMDDSILKLSYGKNVTDEFELISKKGDSFWTETFVTPVKDMENSKVIQHVIMSREITERKKMEETLRYMAYHDGLTNLPNRSYLLKEFPVLSAQAVEDGTTIALLYLDGDDFKLVNDTFGHEVGDEFIRQFGLALSRSLRTEDLVSRIGGDEFVILLTGLPASLDRERDTLSVVDRIKKTLIEGWSIDGIQFSPTASMGVAYYPDHGTSLDELMDKGDQALYEAKKYGKDKFSIYRNRENQKV